MLASFSKPQKSRCLQIPLQAKTFHSHTHRAYYYLGLKMNPSVFSWQEMGIGNSSYSSLTVHIIQPSRWPHVGSEQVLPAKLSRCQCLLLVSGQFGGFPKGQGSLCPQQNLFLQDAVSDKGWGPDGWLRLRASIDRYVVLGLQAELGLRVRRHPLDSAECCPRNRGSA